MEILNFETGLGVEQYRETLRLIERLEAIDDSKELSLTEKIPLMKEEIKNLLEHINTDFHLELKADVSSIYEEMSKNDLLARVEKVKSVIECLAEKTPITVGDKDHHYANCVTADKEGLRIALSEGEALGPVRLLVGLDLKALIGFSNDHIQVEEIEADQFDIRDTTLRRAYCRHIVGEIRADDIKYMVLRIPRNLFPDEQLTSDEKQATTRFIFRGTKIGSEEIAELKEAA